MGQPDLSYKSGFATVVGRPNTGKSTLINALLGQKIAAVSPRPQTTRRRQLGILTLDTAQIIFMDTPGMHNPHHKLGKFMNEVACATLEDADVIVWVVDASSKPQKEDFLIAERIKNLQSPPPTILALNKVDLLPIDLLTDRKSTYQELLPQAYVLPISATLGYGQKQLLKEMITFLPNGEPYYSEHIITDLYEREIAADLIREGALLHLREEVPHSIAIRIDEYTERGEKGAYIAATLFVEKESQKGIVIGRRGEMLKKIGSTARKEIESMTDRKVFLELRVKVKKNWRNNQEILRYLGFINKRS